MPKKPNFSTTKKTGHLCSLRDLCDLHGLLGLLGLLLSTNPDFWLHSSGHPVDERLRWNTTFYTPFEPKPSQEHITYNNVRDGEFHALKIDFAWVSYSRGLQR
jgi:hypothetical protein